MKHRIRIIATCLIVASLLAVTTYVSMEQKILAAELPTDPAHAAHVAAAASQVGGQTVDAQLADMLARIQRLESNAQQQPGQLPSAATMPMGEANPPRVNTMPGVGTDATPSHGGMPGMGMTGEGAALADQLAELRVKMQRLEATIQQQFGSTSGAMPMSDTPGMESGAKPMQGKMAGMGGGGMGMDKMEMAGMMGMSGGSSSMTQSALPGFPGASHLYHIGATGFFLDHPQHIVLTTDQQAALNQAKEQAALAKNTADRAIEQAEQDLWSLTAADQPDNAQIEAKVAEIEKLKGDARLRFISAIGSAAEILNDEQRKILAGFAPPVAAAPAAAPMAGGMSDM